jgi:hypothetical protein
MAPNAHDETHKPQALHLSGSIISMVCVYFIVDKLVFEAVSVHSVKLFGMLEYWNFGKMGLAGLERRDT